MTMTLEEFVTGIGDAYGTDLIAVVLYGSAARGDYIATRSDHNLLVVVREITWRHLMREAAVVRRWREVGNPPPVTLTEGEWLRSSDIFPVEYAEVHAHNRVLHGKLPEGDVGVGEKEFRLQLEHEAMGKVLRLRRAILANGGSEESNRDLLAASFPSMMTVFRGVHRYHHEDPPVEHEALCAGVARIAGIDTTPFVRVSKMVRGTQPIPLTEVTSVLEGYLSGASGLASYLDGCRTQP